MSVKKLVSEYSRFFPDTSQLKQKRKDQKRKLRSGESNPGRPRDRRKY